MNFNSVQEQAHSAFSFKVNKKALEEIIDQRLLIAYTYQTNSGMFKATPELMSFLNLWSDDEIVIKDVYDSPILVNRVELLDQLKQVYQQAMNYWYFEYSKLKKIRHPQNV